MSQQIWPFDAKVNLYRGYYGKLTPEMMVYVRVSVHRVGYIQFISNFKTRAIIGTAQIRIDRPKTIALGVVPLKALKPESYIKVFYLPYLSSRKYVIERFSIETTPLNWLSRTPDEILRQYYTFATWRRLRIIYEEYFNNGSLTLEEIEKLILERTNRWSSHSKPAKELLLTVLSKIKTNQPIVDEICDKMERIENQDLILDEETTYTVMENEKNEIV